MGKPAARRLPCYGPGERAEIDQRQHGAGCCRHEERGDVFRLTAHPVRTPGPPAMRRSLALPVLALLLINTSFGAPPDDPFSHPVTDEAPLRAALSRPAAKL